MIWLIKYTKGSWFAKYPVDNTFYAKCPPHITLQHVTSESLKLVDGLGAGIHLAPQQETQIQRSEAGESETMQIPTFVPIQCRTLLNESNHLVQSFLFFSRTRLIRKDLLNGHESDCDTCVR